MSQDTREDFFQVDSDYAIIGMISSKIRVLIIGAGKAGFIKAKSFAAKGCDVTVVSLDFIDEFISLAQEYSIKLLKERHSSVEMDKYHLIVIAISDNEAIEEIKRCCDNKSKLYLACHKFKEGNFIVPTQGNSKNIYYSVNTKEGSPTTSLFLREKTREFLSEYDELVEYITGLRRTLKEKPELKEIMSFVSNEDFNFFFKKGYANIIIKLFYDLEN